MLKLSRAVAALTIVAALGPLATAAYAQNTPGSGNCNNAIMSPGFTQCWGVNSGNDNAAAVLPLLSALGVGTWFLEAKSDAPNYDPFDAKYMSGRVGDFGFTPALTSPFAISFKHGSYYQLFYFANLTDVDNIRWDLRPVVGTGGPGNYGELSHASLWYTNAADPNVVVPEPSTYAMMLVGLAGMGVAARRRRKV